jgi:hypothetical protein
MSYWYDTLSTETDLLVCRRQSLFGSSGVLGLRRWKNEKRRPPFDTMPRTRYFLTAVELLRYPVRISVALPGDSFSWICLVKAGIVASDMPRPLPYLSVASHCSSFIAISCYTVLYELQMSQRLFASRQSHWSDPVHIYVFIPVFSVLYKTL